MQRIIYFDLHEMNNLEIPQLLFTDPAITQAVERAITQLDPQLHDLVRCRIHMGKAFQEIALERCVSEREIVRQYREALRQLRLLLAGFARQRWGIYTPGLCRICVHPRKAVIEKMLRAKSDQESWGELCRKLKCIVGERFHPPQILIAHLKHVKNNINPWKVEDAR